MPTADEQATRPIQPPGGPDPQRRFATYPLEAGTQPLPAFTTVGPAPGGAPYAPAFRAPLPPPGRVPGWLWPMVVALALVVGLMGGAVGGMAWTVLDDSFSSGQVDAGLDGVDTETAAPLPADNGSIAAVAQRVLPSTVQIVAEFGGDDEGATGSGFVLDRQGHVITNNHVVADAAEKDGPIRIVDQEGNSWPARVVGRSKVYDLAVLYSKGARDLRPASLGESAVLHVGDEVVAFGSPLGLTSTVTAGIVSSLNRPVTTGDNADDLSYINAVQTDAAINPGNSGGPLVDLQGRVVGVNSAIATTGGLSGTSGNIGVGFAIPVEQVRITADQILRTGEARYPVVGATVKTGRSDVDGAEIEEVLADSPAESGGLRSGDVVVRINGQRVTDGIALIVAIRTHRPGETVALVVERDGAERTVEVTLDSKVG